MNRVIFSGRIHYKNVRSANLAKDAFIRYAETIAKGDMMYRPEALYGEELEEPVSDLFLDFPRKSHEASDKTVNHSIQSMETLLQFAMAGRVDCFVITAGELPEQITRTVENDKTTSQHYTLAVEAFEAGDYPTAVAEFTTTINSFKRHPWALDGRGLAQLELGNLAEAEADLRSAREMYPNYPSPHLGLAKIFASRQEFSAAMDSCHKAMASSIPHQPGYWITALFSAEVMIGRLEKDFDRISEAERELYHKSITSYLDRYAMKLKQLGGNRSKFYPTPEKLKDLQERYEGLAEMAT